MRRDIPSTSIAFTVEMKATIAESPHGPIRLVHDRPPPTLRPGYLRVRTVAIALNPADSLYLQHSMCTTGGLLGCDYAGIITEIGPGCKRQWKVGDRLCGCTMPANSEQTREMGTFAEEIVVKGDVAVKVPEGWGWEEAASTGVTVLTTGRCLVSFFASIVPGRWSSSMDLKSSLRTVPEIQRPSSLPGPLCSDHILPRGPIHLNLRRQHSNGNHAPAILPPLGFPDHYDLFTT
jgi:D-arabinose 1-dehydrogenase-like Zn-dependent alcohol dehydrogenase